MGEELTRGGTRNGARRRSAGRRAAAGALGVLLAAGGFGLAPAALADSGPGPLAVTLSAPAPAEIGLAGQPVEYADTVTNTGTTTTDELTLRFTLDGGVGLPSNAASLEYRADDGSWRPVPLEYGHGVFAGTLPGGFTLEPGASRTVRLRIGLPMGTPHNGDSNGGTQALKVRTAVGRSAGGVAAATDDHTIAVDGLSASLSGVPSSVTAGGPGVTFEARAANPTASAYTNVSHVLVTAAGAVVETRHAGAGWTRLTPGSEADEPGVSVFTLDGKDASMGAHTTAVTDVRLSYPKSAGGTKTTVGDCVLVNAAPGRPLSGTTSCGPQSTITVKAAVTGGGSTSPTATPTTTATSTVTTGSGTTTGTTSGAAPTAPPSADTGQLASTGSSGASKLAAGAGVLFLAGAAAVGAAALRRRATR
ncbi:hypothetical protein SAMN05216251_10264 [Actinacidiphila alni]|uniref:Gram-positive cocci surface proteins LPxTG domain-containing protein n=1 Tax=Actinacidiphila alni TaxID=380248 RepID=A0A1I1YKN5_9ACTN|nr:hypothetical protein [Actinacidiphila alni]SFE19862.1 hypothetical protein SAMN05216251_10264 [Actinacidiphila alni]